MGFFLKITSCTGWIAMQTLIYGFFLTRPLQVSPVQLTKFRGSLALTIWIFQRQNFQVIQTTWPFFYPNNPRSRHVSTSNHSCKLTHRGHQKKSTLKTAELPGTIRYPLSKLGGGFQPQLRGGFHGFTFWANGLKKGEKKTSSIYLFPSMGHPKKTRNLWLRIFVSTWPTSTRQFCWLTLFGDGEWVYVTRLTNGWKGWPPTIGDKLRYVFETTWSFSALFWKKSALFFGMGGIFFCRNLSHPKTSVKSPSHPINGSITKAASSLLWW